MDSKVFDNRVANQWCPGCPNFGILKALKQALAELGRRPREVCVVSGIGQAAKLPHYLNCHFFNGLHGRAIPVALGIRAANPDLTILVITGDGDGYGEGGNHFLHAIRRNPDICMIVHNNELYALTKGQASPTTPVGARRTLPVGPVENRPLNMPAVAVLHDVGLVARGFAGDSDHLKNLIRAGLSVRGMAVVEVVQPCITWGDHPVSWYKQRLHKVNDDYDPTDRNAALDALAPDTEKIAVGVLYRGTPKPLFGERFREGVGRGPLYASPSIDDSRITAMLQAYQSMTPP